MAKFMCTTSIRKKKYKVMLYVKGSNKKYKVMLYVKGSKKI